MVEDLATRRLVLREYDDVLKRLTGKAFSEAVSETRLESVRKRLEAVGDDLHADSTAQESEAFALLPVGISPEERGARNRERNRLHARKSRQRKKLLMENLHEQCEACVNDIHTLRNVSEPLSPPPR